MELSLRTSFDAEQTQEPISEELVLQRPAVGGNLIEDLGIIRVLPVEAEDIIEILPQRHCAELVEGRESSQAPRWGNITGTIQSGGLCCGRKNTLYLFGRKVNNPLSAAKQLYHLIQRRPLAPMQQAPRLTCA